ncbi:MAG TPA: hypothetical protein VHB97_25185 [Polyangia bacterium]|nr:hypothetical protein [Polyangia bacterium]
MSRVILRGINGANPLGFFGALGLLRLAHRAGDSARLGFVDDGTFNAFIEGHDAELAALVADDAIRAKDERAWRLEYDKVEKSGNKRVADLKAPPAEFKQYLERCLVAWRDGDDDAVAYAAAFGTSEALDGKGNTKPTAFHFTAAQQQFLDIVEEIRASVTAEWAARSLFEGHAARFGKNLRWDPSAERSRALMANNPSTEETSVDAPLEWLAFRALPLLPTVPVQSGSGIVTTAVTGRGSNMNLTWPLWSVPISLGAARSVLQLAHTGDAVTRSGRGIFAVCSSAIRRNGYYRNFGPSTVTS